MRALVSAIQLLTAVVITLAKRAMLVVVLEDAEEAGVWFDQES
jgi:DNA phosphorothioation-dependent restriction protein DptG